MDQVGKFGWNQDLFLHDTYRLKKPNREKGGTVEQMTAVLDRGAFQDYFFAAILQKTIQKVQSTK